MTHHPFDAATVRDLAALDNVVAIKDSAGEWSAFEGLLGVRAGHPGFRVLQGAEPLAARSLLAGADGLIPGLGNLVPDLFASLVASARAGDAETASAVQARIDALWALHARGYWLICLKYAASLLGFGSGAAVGRSQGLAPPAKAAIERLMEPYAAAVI
jgi:4-hydroxy-tetrahydrodipicolinate synthase